MIPAHHSARLPSVLHIFKVYYPDLFGGTLSVIRDICASLKDVFAAGVLVCSRSGGESRIVVNDVAVERVRSFGDVLSLPAAPRSNAAPSAAGSDRINLTSGSAGEDRPLEWPASMVS